MQNYFNRGIFCFVLCSTPSWAAARTLQLSPVSLSILVGGCFWSVCRGNERFLLKKLFWLLNYAGQNSRSRGWHTSELNMGTKFAKSHIGNTSLCIDRTVSKFCSPLSANGILDSGFHHFIFYQMLLMFCFVLFGVTLWGMTLQKFDFFFNFFFFLYFVTIQNTLFLSS